MYKQNEKLLQNCRILITIEMLALEKGLYQTTQTAVQLIFCQVPILLWSRNTI